MAGTSGTPTVCPSPAPAGKPTAWRRVATLSRLACRYLLAAVFFMAAVSKITDLNGFTDQVLLHAGLPYALGRTTAAVLPWLELTCAACLLFGRAVREAALLLGILLILFLVYSLTHRNDQDCGCFLFP